MLKDINKAFDLQIDTYLVSLKIVSLLKFNGEPHLCRYVAGTIGFMVHKIYENYKLSFNDIYKWSGFVLSK